jgi:hypothetical protein
VVVGWRAVQREGHVRAKTARHAKRACVCTAATMRQPAGHRVPAAAGHGARMCVKGCAIGARSAGQERRVARSSALAQRTCRWRHAVWCVDWGAVHPAGHCGIKASCRADWREPSPGIICLCSTRNAKGVRCTPGTLDPPLPTADSRMEKHLVMCMTQQDQSQLCIAAGRCGHDVECPPCSPAASTQRPTGQQLTLQAAGCWRAAQGATPWECSRQCSGRGKQPASKPSNAPGDGGAASASAAATQSTSVPVCPWLARRSKPRSKAKPHQHAPGEASADGAAELGTKVP